MSDWADKLTLVEFAIIASRSSTTGLTLFKANYGFTPSILNMTRKDVQYAGVADHVDRIMLNISQAHGAIIATRVTQTATQTDCVL